MMSIGDDHFLTYDIILMIANAVWVVEMRIKFKHDGIYKSSAHSCYRHSPQLDW